MDSKYLLLAVFLACATAAHADITVHTTASGKAAFMNVGGDGTILIKGKRQRSESMVGGRAASLLVDIDNLRFVELDDKKKSATITPLATIADDLAKVGVGAM